MLDIKWIRAYPHLFDEGLLRRTLEPQSTHILHLDSVHREALKLFQEKRAKRNKIAKEIAQRKQEGAEISNLVSISSVLSQEESLLEKKVQELSEQLVTTLTFLPNMLDEAVPMGKSEEDNVVLKHWGTPRIFKEFSPKDHETLGMNLGMDFVQATKMSGARFVILAGELARLERALCCWMLDMNTSRFGCLEVHTPCLVKEDAVFGTGQLPKLSEDLFRTTDNRYLIATGEVTLLNLVRETVLEEKDLPLKFTAYTPCFRSEAGAAGKDTKGMIRLHQFEKVELVGICVAQEAEELHSAFLEQEEFLMQSLGLPYRVVALCSADMGWTSRRTYDIEVWLPSQGRYREISSCSNCGTYQSRRTDTRYRTFQGELEYPYTLNGSALPTGRALVAILENYQNSDGSITIPEVLHSYMGGTNRLLPYHYRPIYNL
ncbi:serine--tRNA ligase [Holospora curviuscula]|uniref:Serine--tRNA ligase n=1 Tax=Holospora curviuscula TaxID=1082868 RepID=A0A2S5R823_9PROT|nr:serine--tRNA ligase [Holospora curviuscula]PPE03332.1 Serine--tRNA ligase [Holospora curviuscula]